MTGVETCIFCLGAVTDFVQLKFHGDFVLEDFNFENLGLECIIVCNICAKKLKSLYYIKLRYKRKRSLNGATCCICQKSLASDSRYFLKQILQNKEVLCVVCQTYLPDLISSPATNYIICEVCKLNLDLYSDFINMISSFNANILRYQNIKKEISTEMESNSNVCSEVQSEENYGLEDVKIERDIKTEIDLECTEKMTMNVNTVKEEQYVKLEPDEINNTQEVHFSGISLHHEIEIKTDFDIKDVEIKSELEDIYGQEILQRDEDEYQFDDNLENDVFKSNEFFEAQQQSPTSSFTSLESQNTNYEQRKIREESSEKMFIGGSASPTVAKSVQMSQSSELYYLRKDYIFLTKQLQYYQNLYHRKLISKKRIHNPTMSSFMKFSWATKAIISMQISSLMKPRKKLERKELSAAITSMQIKNKFRPWSYPEKKLAFLIYYKDPLLYEFLKTLNIILPPVSSLKKWMTMPNLFAGINRLYFKLLQLKVETMEEAEKQCVILFSVMEIDPQLEYCKKCDIIEGYEDLGPLGRTSEAADNVLVFMAQGLYANWKIPVSYFLAKGPISDEYLKELVIVTLTKMINAGFSPKVLLGPHVDYSRKMMDLLGITNDLPFFTLKYQKTERKIFCIYDIPDLIGSVWNELFHKNFLINRKVISFYDVDRVYTLDKKLGMVRNLPCIYLSVNGQVPTDLALQVFSQPMASAIKNYVAINLLSPTSAVTTAHFIETVSKLCDSFHHDTSIENLQTLANLQKSLDIFRILLRIDCYQKCCTLSRPPIFGGLVQSINATLLLFDQEKNCWQEDILIPTNKLNSRALLNFFSSAKNTLKRENQLLSARRFRLWYKRQCIQSLSKSVKNSDVFENGVNVSKKLVNVKEEIFENLETPNED